ncbi:MAG: ABC transporter ATP-binding protein [Lachnospiraceae bacterium]|nr:ABC transporter ATP-binding protein [Lachnospiraceae bacterium]
MKKIRTYIQTISPFMDGSILLTSILYLTADSFYTFFVIAVSVILQNVTEKNGSGGINGWMLIMLFILPAFMVFKVLVNKKLAKISFQIGSQIRKEFMRSMLDADYITLRRQGHGEISELVEQDIETVSKSFQESFLPIASGMIQFLIVLAYGLAHSWLLVVAIVTLTVISIILPRVFSPKIYRGYEEITKMQEISREGIKKAIASLQDVHTVKENGFIKKLAGNDFCILKEKQWEYEREVILFEVISAGLGLFTTILWIGLGILFIRAGMINTAVLFAFMNLSDVINWPFVSLPYLIAECNHVFVSIDKINTKTETLRASQNDGKASLFERDEENVQYVLKRVDFSYENVTVISDKNLEIAFPGKILLDGESGCGKSTLLKLLCGLYQPESGEVFLLVGNHKISGGKLAEYISYVEQSAVIMNGTVEDNILFGDYWDSVDTADRDRILETAVKRAELQEFYGGLSEGKNTMLGRNGRELSFGEKQRISIARALARPHNILIMDEPTAHVDEATEDKILKNILSSEESVIMVTHRERVKEKFENRIYWNGGFA